MTLSDGHPERGALHSAAGRLGLDDGGADLVSATSRLIWHLPAAGVALLISRPGTKRLGEVEAEATAVRVATTVGVRTPRLVAGPVELDGDRVALAYHWIAGRSLTDADWPAAAGEIAGLGRGKSSELAVLRWPTDLPATGWSERLDTKLRAGFAARCLRAARSIRAMTADRGALVLCHADVQPANVIVDHDGAPWLIDFEYACLAPREWDPAKLVILCRRFGDPRDVDEVLTAWPSLDPARLTECVQAQETLLVAWLARMSSSGWSGPAKEARRRARSLDEPNEPWRHLR